ncbi:copper transporter 5-like [Thrips palmi]|uniref:Copper transport protein n=1 Tax=Thrips palmi TaxID=161013 RepID=A0A6P8YLR8_THRPL|nr:copper transporter 5-like [Thrips palmi]
MHMTFWFSPDLGNFLFDGYVVQTTRAFIATCAGLGAMAVLLEFFKFWKMNSKKKIAFSQMSNGHNGGSETSALLTGSQLKTNVERILNVGTEVLVYFTQESLNWIVMLAIMGYNGYIFLSVLMGAGLGYAIFGESMAHAKIQSVKMKAAMIACGDCQIKDELEDSNPGQSDPPSNTPPIPSFSGSISRNEPQV